MTNFYEKSGRFALAASVFACGALVMIFEINGSRIMAPYLGTSTYIWTSLIGVILAALSLGYWLGGRIADKFPTVKVLASVIFLAGGLVSIATFSKDIVLGLIASASIGLGIKSFVAAVTLFAPASVAFGFVLPFAVKIRLQSLSDSGRTVGSLYALSTVGSILGTFLAGFVLIPFVGSVRTLYIIAASLFGISVLLAPFVLTQKRLASLILFVFAIAANEMLLVYGWQMRRQIDIDTEYARLSIFDAADPKTNKPIRVIVNDPYFIQSAIFQDSDDLVFEYNRFFHLASYFDPNMKHALMIGGAGYSFPRDFLSSYVKATLDVVEIDPGMTQIAREHFRLRDDPRLNIFHTDARLFLNDAPDATYDAIYMDAFGTLFSVPYQLTTVEAVRNMHRVLNYDGVVIANIGGALTGNGSKFLCAEVATFRAVFDDVRIFKVIADRRNFELQNLILVGVKGRFGTPAAQTDPNISNLLAHEFHGDLGSVMPVLTDDLAPVEYYNSIAQDFRRDVIGK